jgi:hypothetical protein
VDLVVQNLITGGRVGGASGGEVDGASVGGDTFEDVVDVIERGDVIERSGGVLLSGCARRRQTNLDAAVISVIDVIVRVRVVVATALDDANAGGENPAVAFDEIVLDGIELRNIGVGVGRRWRFADPDA